MLHLLHPAFVHFSVAFLVAGALAEAFGVFREREAVARFGSVLVLLGLASMVPAMVTGYLAANTVDLPARAENLLARHERNAWFVLGVFFAGVFWKAWCRGQVPRRWRLLYVGLLLAGAGLVAYSGYLGAEMVYGHGVGVTAP